jgi:putative membrane-bound dehydrogenase-like protein
MTALLLALGASACRADVPDTCPIGVARVDITPTYPVRLSGFGFRRTESEGVTQCIWAKALAIGASEPAVLVTVDNLGVPAYMVDDLARRLAGKGVRRDRLAVTATHTHTAPMLTNVAPTLFGAPIPREHQEHIDRYTRELTDKLEKVALAALADRKPARLSWGVGSVGFARNRRTRGGRVDHDLPLLAVRDPSGKLRAVWVSYACHCVTLSNNKVSGDWAGYAQQAVEDDHPGAVALVSIGCGGDANPDSGVTGDKTDIASRQGLQIATEVNRLLRGYLAPVGGPLRTRLSPDLALPLADLPSRPQWEQRSRRTDAIGYHARVQLARLDRGESLKTRIPYCVQTWTFGDCLALVFLPGEVVVDYGLRLKRELDGRRLWVNAYSNDDPCYIPSERVLKEGGYEGGGAMVYYDVPAPFRPGLEAKIIGAVKDQLAADFGPRIDAGRTGGSLPLSPQQSLAAIKVKPGFAVDLVAAEPLVASPVAIDFGPDGRLWVAEMYDYPSGTDGKFRPGGRVRVLEDTDGDGIFDRSTVFLDNIPFPTGVTAWRNGVLVCAAPDILYAEDTRGGGRADHVEKLYSGFGTDNYQARVNSLAWGLDGWVYGSCGLFGGTILSHRTGKVLELGDRDFRIRPATGEIEPATGRTQQGRSRDDWGNWFGCDNSELCRHYPLADHYLRRNPHAAAGQTAVHVPDYPDWTRLYPIRPQQLFKLSGPPNRVTAACGLGLYRDDLLGKEYQGDVFTCEPVNLVVHRLKLSPRGSSFSGRRAPDELDREFLASTDGWFRPVQVRTGPDGALWVVDMYRYVIEHPRWIPPEDVADLDVRAGSHLGRIYRVRPVDRPLRKVPRLDRLDAAGLVAALDTANGTVRDLAAQIILWRREVASAPALERLAASAERPEMRLQALCVLDGLGCLTPALARRALDDPHAGVRRHAVRLAERCLAREPDLGPALLRRADDDAQVRLQLAYSLGAWRDPRAGPALLRLALAHRDDPHLAAAVLSSANKDNIADMLATLLTARTPPEALVQGLLATAVGLGDHEALGRALARVIPRGGGRLTASQLSVAAAVLDWLARRRQAPESVLDATALRHVREARRQARRLAEDDSAAEADRLAAIGLLGLPPGDVTADGLFLVELLKPQNSSTLQTAALASAGRAGSPTVAARLLAGWRGYTPAVRAQALDLLLSRDGWLRELLGALEKGAVPRGDLDAARRQRLLCHKDARVRHRAARLLEGGGSADRQRVLRDYADALSLKGDPVRGKAVFARACSVCHKLEGVGHEVGPDLVSVAPKPPGYLLQEILDPNRNVDSRYQEYVVQTRSGRTLNGLLAAETATGITLRGSEGKEQVLLRGEIEELASAGRSLMPEGLEKDISKQQMADLLAYLAAQGRR